MPSYKTMIAVTLLGLLTSGCYELSEPVIDKGSRADIAGSFQCANQMDGKRGTETVKEVSSGLIFKDYKYVLSDGTELDAEAIKGSFYLMQTRKQQKLNVAYFDISDRSFSVMIPNLMTQSSAVDMLAAKYGVRFNHNAGGAVGLLGDKAKILEFLKAHNAGMMTTVMTCVKA